MRKSLKKIVSDIEDWTNQNSLLESFNFGDIDVLFKSENHTYRKLWLIDTSARLSGATYQSEITFKLMVMDIQNSSNELDVLSDCQSICFDFINTFIEADSDTFGWFILPESCVLEPFREVMNDTLSGYSLEFTVNCGGGLPCSYD